MAQVLIVFHLISISSMCAVVVPCWLDLLRSLLLHLPHVRLLFPLLPLLPRAVPWGSSTRRTWQTCATPRRTRVRTLTTSSTPPHVLSVFLFPFCHLSDEQQPELTKKIMENLCDPANNGSEDTYDVLYLRTFVVWHFCDIDVLIDRAGEPRRPPMRSTTLGCFSCLTRTTYLSRRILLCLTSCWKPTPRKSVSAYSQEWQTAPRHDSHYQKLAAKMRNIALSILWPCLGSSLTLPLKRRWKRKTARWHLAPYLRVPGEGIWAYFTDLGLWSEDQTCHHVGTIARGGMLSFEGTIALGLLLSFYRLIHVCLLAPLPSLHGVILGTPKRPTPLWMFSTPHTIYASRCWPGKVPCIQLLRTQGRFTSYYFGTLACSTWRRAFFFCRSDTASPSTVRAWALSWKLLVLSFTKAPQPVSGRSVRSRRLCPPRHSRRLASWTIWATIGQYLPTMKFPLLLVHKTLRHDTHFARFEEWSARHVGLAKRTTE